MTTILFEPKEKHLEFEWYDLFTETWKSQETEKRAIGKPWSFEIGHEEATDIQEICDSYALHGFVKEACCLFFRMKNEVENRAGWASREQWDIIKGPHSDLGKRLTMLRVKDMFALEKVEFIKLKHADSELAYRYEGDLMKFICQAVLEKYERDGEQLKSEQRLLAEIFYKTKELMPIHLRERPRELEEYIAYGTFRFFKSESSLTISNVDRFCAQLMKLAGFEFPSDRHAGIDAIADDYIKNFRKWRESYEKFMDRNN